MGYRTLEQAQGNGALLPSIHSKPYHHRYPNHLTNTTTSTVNTEYPSVMTSKKSSAHGSYLPSIPYTEKGPMKVDVYILQYSILFIFSFIYFSLICFIFLQQSALFSSKHHHFQGHGHKAKSSPTLPPITKQRTGAG